MRKTYNKLEKTGYYMYIDSSNGEVNRSKMQRNEVFSGIWN